MWLTNRVTVTVGKRSVIHLRWDSGNNQERVGDSGVKHDSSDLKWIIAKHFNLKSFTDRSFLSVRSYLVPLAKVCTINNTY